MYDDIVKKKKKKIENSVESFRERGRRRVTSTHTVMWSDGHTSLYIIYYAINVQTACRVSRRRHVRTETPKTVIVSWPTII